MYTINQFKLKNSKNKLIIYSLTYKNYPIKIFNY